VPALEPLRGLRVVAVPEALDEARWRGAETIVLRIAPDEAVGFGSDIAVETDDPDAIVEPEAGFVGAWCSPAELGQHVDWQLGGRLGLQQGKVAGVPARVVVQRDRALVITAAAYADDLATRLGWPR
jgi:hypothetical protein